MMNPNTGSCYKFNDFNQQFLNTYFKRICLLYMIIIAICIYRQVLSKLLSKLRVDKECRQLTLFVKQKNWMIQEPSRQILLLYSYVRYASKMFIVHSFLLPNNVHTYILQTFIRVFMKHIQDMSLTYDKTMIINGHFICTSYVII